MESWQAMKRFRAALLDLMLTYWQVYVRPKSVETWLQVSGENTRRWRFNTRWLPLAHFVNSMACLGFLIIHRKPTFGYMYTTYIWSTGDDKDGFTQKS